VGNACLQCALTSLVPLFVPLVRAKCRPAVQHTFPDPFVQLPVILSRRFSLRTRDLPLVRPQRSNAVIGVAQPPFSAPPCCRARIDISYLFFDNCFFERHSAACNGPRFFSLSFGIPHAHFWPSGVYFPGVARFIRFAFPPSNVRGRVHPIDVVDGVQFNSRTAVPFPVYLFLSWCLE